MKSDTLVTLLMGILAVFFGVINAKNKKKKTQPGKQIPDVRVRAGIVSLKTAGNLLQPSMNMFQKICMNIWRKKLPDPPCLRKNLFL